MLKVVMHVGGGHQSRWMYAALQGFKRHGISPLYENVSRPILCDLAVVWGVRKNNVLEAQRKHGKDFLVLERGYFDDRFSFTSAGFNGLNREAEFYNKGKGHKRWDKFGVQVKPWKIGGKQIIIAGQVQGDMSCHGLDLKKWYGSLIDRIRARGIESPIVFKPHPLARIDSCPKGLPKVDTFKDAKWVLAFNSNSLVDMALAGVPCIGFDDKTMAWDVIGHGMEGMKEWVPGDRTQWCYDLAWTQWSLKEFEKGDVWDHLRVRYT